MNIVERHGQHNYHYYYYTTRWRINNQSIGYTGCSVSDARRQSGELYRICDHRYNSWLGPYKAQSHRVSRLPSNNGNPSMRGNVQRAWNANTVNHAGMTMTDILLMRLRGGVQYATVERASERELDAQSTNYNDHSESLRYVRSGVQGVISCAPQRLSSRGCSRGGGCKDIQCIAIHFQA